MDDYWHPYRNVGKIFDVIQREDQQLQNELDASNADNENKSEEIKQLKKQLFVHESWNHSCSQAIIFTKSRKELQTKAKYLIANKDKTISDGPPKKKPGQQPGAEGKSHDGKSEYTNICSTKTCLNCGRTDVRPSKIIWKTIFDVSSCGKTVCYMECIIPVLPGVQCYHIPRNELGFRQRVWSICAE